MVRNLSMKNKNLLMILVLILIIIFFAYSYYMPQRYFPDPPPSENTYIANLKWYHSLDKGFLMAQQENKPIAMYFWAIWCQKCAKFQADILGNKDTNKILEEDYILVAKDLDVDREVARKYNVTYPPYVFFLDGNGNVLERVNGTVDADAFLNLTTQVRDRVRAK